MGSAELTCESRAEAGDEQDCAPWLRISQGARAGMAKSKLPELIASQIASCNLISLDWAPAARSCDSSVTRGSTDPQPLHR